MLRRSNTLRRSNMLRIDIAKSFQRLDDPSTIQPPDYTDYASGDQRLFPPSRVTGIITQEGLMKREVDKNVIKTELTKSQNWVANGSSVKPVKNVGILSVVDKFFNWLNRVLGA